MTTHTGLDHVQAHWDAVGNARNERAVAFVPDGASFFETGVTAAGRFLAALPPALAQKPHLTILELGAGLGRVSASLARAGHHVVAVDIAPAMIAALTTLAAGLREASCPGSITPLLSDGTTLDTFAFEPGIDVVYSDSVLLHNLKKDVRTILQSCRRTVVPGGYVIVQLPCYAADGKDPEHWTDVGVWTPAELAEAAGAAGLLVEHMAANPGVFSFDNIGPVHANFHVFRRPDGHSLPDSLRHERQLMTQSLAQMQASNTLVREENERLRAENDTFRNLYQPSPVSVTNPDSTPFNFGSGVILPTVPGGK